MAIGGAAATGCGAAIIMVGALGAADITVGGGVAPIMTVGEEGCTRMGVDGGETTTGDWDGLLKTGLAWTGTITVAVGVGATGAGGAIRGGCEVTGACGEPCACAP
jgi:hypothetical protein